jgi:DNA-nicking Smr family endonuclease
MHKRTASARKPGRAVAPDEEWLWREVTKDVRAFRPVKRPALPAAKPARIETARPVHTHTPQQATPRASAPPPLGTGLDGATSKRLGKGQIAPDATLDLHGMTQDHAHRALDRFLTHSLALSRRCVLVVTGKGARQKQDPGPDAPWMRRGSGILSALVPLWLE